MTTLMVQAKRVVAATAAVVVVFCCCMDVVAAGSGDSKSLQCIVVQAAADVPPTTTVLPDGNLLFNQLQYAINRCPFEELYIPPSTTDSLPIDCLIIANHFGAFTIRGGNTPSSKNRSTIVVNATTCAAAERRALINVIASADIVFDAIAVVVLNPVLPKEVQRANTFTAIALDQCNNITFTNVLVDLIGQNSFELVGWGSLMQVNYSTNIQLVSGHFAATTMSYASVNTADAVAANDGVDDDLPIPPMNLTFPSMTTIMCHHTTGLSMIGTSLKISSDLGHVHRVHNVTNFTMQGCYVEVDLVLPPPIKSLTTNKSILPPQAVLPTPIMIADTVNVMITSSEFVVVCGIYCNKVLLTAVILIVSGMCDHHTVPAPWVKAVLIKDVQLTFEGSLAMPNLDIVPASSNFVVISSPSVECAVIDNVSTLNAISISSNSVVINSRNLSWSVLSRVQVVQAGLTQSLPMGQSLRYFPPPNPSSVLVWMETETSPPVPSMLLQSTNAHCHQFITQSVPTGDGPSENFWHCCTDQTTFWGGMILAVLVVLSMSVFLFRRRAKTAKVDLAVAAAADAVVHVQVSRDTLNVDENLIPSMSDPLLPSERSIAQSGMSPRDEQSTARSTGRRVRRDDPQVETPKTALLISGQGSATNSDMVLYMPGGDGGWSTRSAAAGAWVWTPRAPGAENSGQNSLSANSLCSGRGSVEKSGADHHHSAPIISLSSPGASLAASSMMHPNNNHCNPQPKPMLVKSTADSTPFDNGRHRSGGDSVHSSQFSSSTEGDDDDDANEANNDDADDE